jgi:hypothetical protein
MKKIYLATLIFALMVISMICIQIATAEDLVFKQGQIVDLKIPCINNGTYCSSSAVCYITISKPDGVLLVNNQTMDNMGAYNNYTLDGNQTQFIGSYPTLVVCEDGGWNGYSSFSFEITSTGSKSELANNIFLIIVFAIAFVMFLFGINRNDWVFVMLAGFLFIVEGVYVYYNPFIFLSTVLNLVLSIILWAIGAYLIIRTSIELSNFD